LLTVVAIDEGNIHRGKRLFSYTGTNCAMPENRPWFTLFTSIDIA